MTHSIDNRPNIESSTATCGSDRQAKDVMQCGLISVQPDQPVYDAIGLMAERQLSGLPVTEAGKIVGIISEKDILRLLYEKSFLPGTVADYMTKNVVCFTMEDELSTIGQCFITHDFRRVAIEHDGHLAGLITRSDLIKHSLPRLESNDTPMQDTPSSSGPMAEDVMRTGLLTIGIDTPLPQAARTMAYKRVTGLPVVDSYMNLSGILSEKDILCALYDPTVRSTDVADLMTRDVISFRRQSSLFDICQCLIDNAFRRVPILDQGRLIGLISRADLVIYIMKNKSTVFSRQG
ncbi:CBS domain-containing protein [Planctomycetota bacterium]